MNRMHTRKNASFVFDTDLLLVSISEEAASRSPKEGEECVGSGSTYIVPDEQQQKHPTTGTIIPSVTQYSEFGDDEASLDLLVTCTNAIHGSDGHTLPADTEEHDENEEDNLSDMESALDRFSNPREGERRDSAIHVDSQADSHVENDTRAIDVLRHLICATHVSSLIVSLSAALASTSAKMTYIHVAFIILLFCTSFSLFWDREKRVNKRRCITLETAAKSNAMVDSLFPAVVRDRLFDRKKRNDKMSKESDRVVTSHRIFPMTPKRRLQKYLSNTAPTDQSEPETYADEPIAEMFHDTTIMFADIVGFTAWSSEREPAQVFTLLETLYRAFDEVARKLKVFKVETIGDCYVAVTGLPEPRSDHAIVMAIFAWECRKLMGNLTKHLEISLGPGTSDLALRIGLHSGSVTAGVLRGEKSRFQLFGDTMNTASRLESTSKSGMIQVSQSTADLISSGSKSHWLTARDDMVFAKGKGMMKTWWVQPQKSKSTSFSKYHLSSEIFSISENGSMATHQETLSSSNTNTLVGVVPPDKEDRLVDWCADILSHSLAGVVSARNAIPPEAPSGSGLIRRKIYPIPAAAPSISGTNLNAITKRTIYPELSEVVELPKFDRQKVAPINNDPSILSTAVRDQLRDFVVNIATRHHHHDFHNFEHASHVLLSANKLMKRIISPDSIYSFDHEEDVHTSSFGISSDPLTQFTILLSALVHDVEHTGVPNTVLVAAHDDVAIKYANKSVAEQNSVDVALSLLSWPRFQELRAAIHATNTERDLFHQILVNAVLATDIVDEDLNNQMQESWSNAFGEEEDDRLTPSIPNALLDHQRVTVVIAHIIQASDMAHTMQHWHVFCRWNEKLFMENYQSFKSEGFSSMDWYMQEMSFFDDYVIPLARKLKESGVFGVSSDECLNHALANQDEWMLKGQDIAKQLVAKANARFLTDNKKKAVVAITLGKAA